MRSRSTVMFITPDEFSEIAAAAAAELALWTVGHGWRRGGQIKLTSAPRGQLAELAGESGWLWALPDPPPAPLAKDMLAPLGVRLPPPRIDGDALLKIQIDARSPHNHVIKLHGQLARRFKNVLTRPVHAWHVDAPDRPHAYRDIGYSPGALAWYEQGGDWRQEGVAYIRYGPPPS